MRSSAGRPTAFQDVCGKRWNFRRASYRGGGAGEVDRSTPAADSIIEAVLAILDIVQGKCNVKNHRYSSIRTNPSGQSNLQEDNE